MRYLALVLLLFAGSANALTSPCAVEGETLQHVGDLGTTMCAPLQLLPASSTTGEIPFAKADGTADHSAMLRFVNGILQSPNIQVQENTLDDVNGFTFPMNNISGGTLGTCASVGWHGNGANQGQDKYSIGDLDAGSGFAPETCMNNEPAPVPKRAQFAAAALTPTTSVRCLAATAGGNTPVYDPIANLTNFKAALLNPSRPFRLRSITVADFGDQTGHTPGTGVDAGNKAYVDVYTCPVTGEFLSITGNMVGCTWRTRVTWEWNGVPTGTGGALTDTNGDEKGLPIFDMDDGNVFQRELNIPVDLGATGESTVHVCAISTDNDWTGETGTAPAWTPDVSVELEYDN